MTHIHDSINRRRALKSISELSLERKLANDVQEIERLKQYGIDVATLMATEVGRLTGIINKIGEANNLIRDAVEKEQEWARNAVAALKSAEKELTHDVPNSCYSTGPMTGDPIQDLVACPGCAALAKVRAALNIQQRASE